MPVQYTCRQCGRGFAGKATQDRIYCSRICQGAARHNSIAVPCAFCGRVCVLHQSDIARGGRYCSQTCAIMARAQGLPGFWHYVDTSLSCWTWTGTRNVHGYGRWHRDKKTILAHRHAWFLASGEDPGALFVCHTCDTPSCVRNDDAGIYTVGDCTYRRYGHLFLADYAANSQDMWAKGRHIRQPVHPPTLEQRPRGERHGCAKLSAAQVDAIRATYREGKTSCKKLGLVYAVDATTVHRIVTYRKWRGLP